MSRKSEPHDQEKHRLNRYTRATYPAQVDEGLKALCPVCQFRNKRRDLEKTCDYDLLPLTTKGARCPYYTYDLDTLQPPRPPDEASP